MDFEGPLSFASDFAETNMGSDSPTVITNPRTRDIPEIGPRGR